MKSPIGPLIMRKMPVNDYIKKNLAYLKKALTKGVEEVPCLVIESHDYLCGKNHAFTYYGAQSQVIKLYKILEKEKKQNAALSYAKGTCRIALDENKTINLSYALKGTIKTEAVKKNKRKLFQKMGINLIDVKKGEFEKVKALKEEKDELLESTAQEEEKEDGSNNSSTEETTQKTPSDDKDIITAAKTFQRMNASMKKEVLPLLTAKEEATYTQAAIDMAEEAYKSVVEFMKHYDSRKKAGVAYEKPTITKLQGVIVKNDLQKKYLNVWKKIKIEHKKEMDALDAVSQTKLQRVEALLKEIQELETQQSLA